MAPLPATVAHLMAQADVSALTIYNVVLIGLAFSEWYWFSFTMILISGVCHAYFHTCAQVMLQTLVEDRYRGRVMSGFLLNAAGEWARPRRALAGGATIMLCYVWLSLVRAGALKKVVLAPKSG